MPVIKNRNQSINFEDIGSGPAVVLGHSFLCSGKMWREQVPALAENHRVINIDFRGHGQSGRVEQPFTLYDAVLDVVAVLDELGIEKATWCGLSIGGMVALRAALSCPERVDRLIIMDSHAGGETAVKKLRYKLMGLVARYVGVGPLLSPIAKLMFGATTFKQIPALVSEWKQEFAAVHIPSILHGLAALVKRDSLVERLPEITKPTLVIAGEEDRSLPVNLSEEIHNGLPNSQLVKIPQAGHLSTLENPDAVNESVLKFIES